MNRGLIGITNEDIDYGAGLAAGYNGGMPGVQSGNVLIGWESGRNIQTNQLTAAGGNVGRYNTFIGYQAGISNTTGDSNVAIGYQVGPVGGISGGVYVGYLAGNVDTGGNNTFIGYLAGAKNTTGNQNVYIGYFGANNATTVGSNVCIGYQTSPGNPGTIVGHSAGGGNFASVVVIGSSCSAAGASSVSVGHAAGGGTTGVAIGYFAGSGNNTSAGSTFIGSQSGQQNTSGVNTFVGFQSGNPTLSTAATTTGTGQTCLGWNTGQAASVQVNFITCLGYGTTAGSVGCVAIGVDSTGTSATTSIANQFQLGTSLHAVNFPGKITVPVGGAAAIAGTGTLSGGSASVSTTAVTASSLIFLTDATASLTNVGTLSVSAKTAGTSFTVTSANALDTSTFNWFMIN